MADPSTQQMQTQPNEEQQNEQLFDSRSNDYENNNGNK